jgi:hypothetical protein
MHLLRYSDLHPQWVADARTMLAGAEPAIAPGPQCTKPLYFVSRFMVAR